MDFGFTEEQELFRRSVREFCERVIAPKAMAMERRGAFDKEVIQGMADMGLFGLTIKPEYGGSGADAITVGIAAEEIARADISCATAVLFLVPAAWGYILQKFGSEGLKEEVLPRLAKGRIFVGIATTEAGAGSDLAGMTTTAVRKGDYYALSGEKLYISGIREATELMPEGGGFLVLAKTKPELGARGLSFFYVPVKGAEGVSTYLIEEIGRKAVSAGGIVLKDARVPARNRLGEENRGFYMAMEGFDFARSIISVVCAGAAMEALKEGMEYAKQRRAFGQPIARYEGIQFKLAEDYARLDAVRLLGYRALWLFDQEQRYGKASRFEVTKAAAVAKMLAPTVAFEAMNDVLQWYGAFGYTTECPIEMGLRGVRSYMLAEGTTEIMKLIVARELLGKEYAAHR